MSLLQYRSAAPVNWASQNREMDEMATESQLLELLREVRWDRIAADLSMPLEYGKYASDSLLKIHLLPYLLPIKSERQLAFAVGEKDVLGHSVGLTSDAHPLRGTLWHFRKRNPLFRTLLARGLAVIYLEAEARGIAVPFLGDKNCVGVNTEPADRFYDKTLGAAIEIRHPVTPRIIKREEQLRLPLDIQDLASAQLSARLLLPDEIGFPLYLSFTQPQFIEKCAVLQQPPWLNKPYGHFEVGDLIVGKKAPYTACNIVVKRSIDGREHVLLSQRLQGAGKGTYTLPGGKKHEDETIRACVRRELEEETGLILLDAQPISVTNTNVPGYPQVRSIGVVASTRGEPQRRERHQHSNWNWYDLYNLPSPLFFPTERVLRDLKANDLPSLTWDDLEGPEELPLWKEEAK